MVGARSSLARSPRRLGRRRRAATLAAAAAALVLVLPACATNDGRTLTPPNTKAGTTVVVTTTTAAPPQQVGPNGSTQSGTPDPGADPGTGADGSTPTGGSLAFASNSMVAGQVADTRFSCSGAGISPSLLWAGVPAGTVELAVVATDLDLPPTFVHWAVTGIPPDSNGIPEGQVTAGVQATNSAGKAGWLPFCPPGGQTHHYQFALFAMSAPSGITQPQPAAQVLDQLAKQGSPAASFTVLFHTP
jgi:Raf kinase inhibitor-like YbhB/YbcL family protein